jgi:hypothetical protein
LTYHHCHRHRHEVSTAQPITVLFPVVDA